MMRNLVIGFALLIAVVGIAIAPVHAADADLSSMIEEYKNKAQIDVNIRDQGTGGVDIDISYYLFDENGLPVKLNKTMVDISITTIETGYYGLKDHFAHAYVRICAIEAENGYGSVPYGSIKWDEDEYETETKEMIVPVKREDGVIELRSMNVDVQHIRFRVMYFDSALGGHYIRSFGDPVSVHVVIYVMGQKYPVSTVKQYVHK